MGIIDRSMALGNRERMIRTCLNQDIDRLPFWYMFGPWEETLDRWRAEGFACNEYDDWKTPFDFDAGFEVLPVNLGFCPWFERKVLSEDGDKQTIIDEFGITMVEKKDNSTIPYFIDNPVKTREDWEAIKAERLDPNSPERFPENWIDKLEEIKEKDAAIQIGEYPYGLFGACRDLMGVENLLVAFYDEPELIHEIMDYLTEFWITIYKKALKDIQIDHIHIWEDMSGRQGPLISPAMFREFMTPNYKKIVNFAKENGIPIVSVDTDGNTDLLMPLFEECGINLVLPFEVQAGCDVVEIRKNHPTISIFGGIDKRQLAFGHTEIDRELERVSELFKASGYIPALDHLVPPDVSYDNFCYFVSRLKEMLYEIN